MNTGWLMMSGGWGQVHKTEVEIIGQTPRKYRIRAIVRTKIGGRYRWIEPGDTVLVPKYAIWIDHKEGIPGIHEGG